MTYQLRFEAAPGEELRAVLVAQADLALQALSEGASESGVHEARKACKRARAASRLLEPSLGRTAARAVEQAFRDAARRIGPVRDADVMRATLRRLDEEAHAVEAVHDRDDRAEDARRILGQLRARLERLELAGVDREGLVRALVRSWSRTRRALRSARRDPSSEPMHEWRKETKRTFHQLQLLQGLDPSVLGPLTCQLDVLQELLGDHHDVCVLQQTLPAERQPSGAAERERDLAERALALGEWLLAAEADALARWLDLEGR